MPVVIITGASQGIGKEVALAFSRSVPDTRLALVARSKGDLETTADLCREAGAEAKIYPCDVTEDEAVFQMAGRVKEELGVPDVVVNNAGSFAPGGVLEMGARDFREQIDANLTSAFLVTSAFLKEMVERGSGDVFYMASVASIVGYPRSVAYGAAKHGMLGMARALREETKEHGIRVITLLPGATYTRSWAASGLPAERYMPPEDIADLLVAAYKMDRRTVVEEILLRPQMGDV